MTVLVTGFEPFGGDAENASGAAVRRLAELLAEEPVTGPDGGPVRVRTAELPVTFAGSGAELARLVAETEPSAVLCVGEAGGRTALTPELTARNLQDARIPDNAGAQPRGLEITPGAPDLSAAHNPSALDPAALVEAIRAAGLPAELSSSAGLFVCNHVFYRALELADESTLAGRPARAGFLHVPAVRTAGTATVGSETDDDAAPAGAGPRLPSQPPLTVDDLARGLRAAVEAIAAGRA